MSERIRHNSKKISLHTAAYFIAIMVMLRPANPALQSLFGATLGEILNVILKLGDYILITGVIFYAVAYRIIRRNSILTIQSRLICCFLAVLTISTFLNGTLDNFRAYYEYLGNIFCIVFLYQKARTNQRRFNAFLQGAACFLTLAMLLNSLSIYIYYPNGMYVLDDGVTGNNNYYLFSLDNVGFIISLCSFGVSAVYDQFIGKKIKRSTIFKYIIVFGAYFYCRAATAIIVGIMLLIALVLYRIKWLRGLNFKWALIICAVSFGIIISIQSFSSFDWLFALLGKNSLLGGRLRIWNAALSGWLDNFWVGIGIDSTVTSTVLYQHGFITAGWGQYIGHAHNIIFEVLLKSGLIGTICFFWQLLACYKKMMSCRNSKIIQFLCVVFLLFWITSLLDYRIEQISGWLLFMLMYDADLLDARTGGVVHER